jgi:hypothetical protein
VERKDKISAKTILHDIRSGMTEAAIMDKYDLSPVATYMIYRKLVEEQYLDPEKLYGRTHANEGSADRHKQRRLLRVPPEVPLVVHDFVDPENKGWVSDMTETGIGVRGMAAEVDESKILAIPPNGILLTKRFVFKATCRWARMDKENHEAAAGFEIIEVIEGYFLDFVRLMGGIIFTP